MAIEPNRTQNVNQNSQNETQNTNQNQQPTANYSNNLVGEAGTGEFVNIDSLPPITQPAPNPNINATMLNANDLGVQQNVSPNENTVVDYAAPQVPDIPDEAYANDYYMSQEMGAPPAEDGYFMSGEQFNNNTTQASVTDNNHYDGEADMSNDGKEIKKSDNWEDVLKNKEEALSYLVGFANETKKKDGYIFSKYNDMFNDRNINVREVRQQYRKNKYNESGVPKFFSEELRRQDRVFNAKEDIKRYAKAIDTHISDPDINQAVKESLEKDLTAFANTKKADLPATTSVFQRNHVVASKSLNSALGKDSETARKIINDTVNPKKGSYPTSKQPFGSVNKKDTPFAAFKELPFKDEEIKNAVFEEFKKLDYTTQAIALQDVHDLDIKGDKEIVEKLSDVVSKTNPEAGKSLKESLSNSKPKNQEENKAESKSTPDGAKNTETKNATPSDSKNKTTSDNKSKSQDSAGKPKPDGKDSKASSGKKKDDKKDDEKENENEDEAENALEANMSPAQIILSRKLDQLIDSLNRNAQDQNQKQKKNQSNNAAGGGNYPAAGGAMPATGAGAAASDLLKNTVRLAGSGAALAFRGANAVLGGVTTGVSALATRSLYNGNTPVGAAANNASQTQDTLAAQPTTAPLPFASNINAAVIAGHTPNLSGNIFKLSSTALLATTAAGLSKSKRVAIPKANQPKIPNLKQRLFTATQNNNGFGLLQRNAQQTKAAAKPKSFSDNSAKVNPQKIKFSQPTPLSVVNAAKYEEKFGRTNPARINTGLNQTQDSNSNVQTKKPQGYFDSLPPDNPAHSLSKPVKNYIENSYAARNRLLDTSKQLDAGKPITEDMQKSMSKDVKKYLGSSLMLTQTMEGNEKSEINAKAIDSVKDDLNKWHTEVTETAKKHKVKGKDRKGNPIDFTSALNDTGSKLKSMFSSFGQVLSRFASKVTSKKASPKP